MVSYCRYLFCGVLTLCWPYRLTLRWPYILFHLPNQIVYHFPFKILKTKNQNYSQNSYSSKFPKIPRDTLLQIWYNQYCTVLYDYSYISPCPGVNHMVNMYSSVSYRIFSKKNDTSQLKFESFIIFNYIHYTIQYYTNIFSTHQFLFDQKCSFFPENFFFAN